MSEKKSFLPSLSRKKKGEEQPEQNVDLNAPFTPRLPTLNFIPVEVLEGYKLKALQAKFVKGIGVLTVAILALWAALFGLEKMTQMRVTAAQEEANSYAAEVQTLQPYADYRDAVQSKRTTIGEKMSTEVDTGAIVDELRKISDDTGVSLSSSIQISVSTGEAASPEGGAPAGGGEGCQAADPFTSQPSIGCVTFTGEGERSDVADFIEKLNAHDFFNNTFVPETTSGETSSFTGSVNYTGGFLTNAYADLLSDGEEAAPADAENTEALTEILNPEGQ